MRSVKTWDLCLTKVLNLALVETLLPMITSFGIQTSTLHLLKMKSKILWMVMILLTLSTSIERENLSIHSIGINILVLIARTVALFMRKKMDIWCNLSFHQEVRDLMLFTLPTIQM